MNLRKSVTKKFPTKIFFKTQKMIAQEVRNRILRTDELILLQMW